MINAPPIKPRISPTISFINKYPPKKSAEKRAVRIGFNVVTKTPPAPANPTWAPLKKKKL